MTFLLMQWKFVVIGVLVALLGVSHLRTEHAHAKYTSLQASVEKDKADRATVALEATNENTRISNRWNAQNLGAINDAKTREASLQAAIDRVSDERSRLLDAIKSASVRRDVPRPAGKASPEPAVALGDVLGECSAEVQRLAGAADRHASDVRTLMEAWPK